MADCTEGCPAAAMMFGVAGIRVLLAERDHRGLRLTVETDQTVEGCHGCGVLAGLHDRREQLLHDTPFGHRRVLVRWRKRVWRCHEPACPVVTFTETHPLAAPRALLTRRAVIWAADALAEDDTNRRGASAPAGRRLAHPVGRACGRGAAPGRRPDSAAGGRVARRRRAVWRPGRFGAGREVTCMVDLSRNTNGQVRRVCSTWCYIAPARLTPGG